MRSSIFFFIALLSTSMAFPSPLSFPDTIFDAGDDLSQRLAFGDSTTPDTSKSGSDVNSDSNSGTYSKTNPNFVTDSNTDVFPDVPRVNLAPSSVEISSGSHISTNVLADFIPQETYLTAQNAVGPCPQDEDWASFQRTSQTQDETTRMQREANQAQHGTNEALEKWHDALDTWQATLERCQTILISGGRCSFKKHPKPRI